MSSHDDNLRSIDKVFRILANAPHQQAKQRILDALPIYGKKSVTGKTVNGKTVKQISDETGIPAKSVSGYLQTLKHQRLPMVINKQGK